MPSLRIVSDKMMKTVSNIGRAGLHANFPNDFEYYLMALELVDSEGGQEDYLLFPVMPSQIQKIENNRTSIKKSSSGTTVLYSDSPTPNELSLKGDFGKGFKLLANYKESIGYSKAINFNQLSFTMPTFEAGVKTGYGAIKVLQSICNKSSQMDYWGNPRRLFLYNLALGESYLCVVPNGGLTINQDYDRNMIWSYNLNLSLIANIEDLNPSTKSSSTTELLKASIIQQGISSLFSDAKTMVQASTNKILAIL